MEGDTDAEEAEIATPKEAESKEIPEEADSKATPEETESKEIRQETEPKEVPEETPAGPEGDMDEIGVAVSGPSIPSYQGTLDYFDEVGYELGEEENEEWDGLYINNRNAYLEKDYGAVLEEIFTKYSSPDYSIIRDFSTLTLQKIEEHLYNAYMCIQEDEPLLDTTKNVVFLEENYHQVVRDIFTKYSDPNYKLLREFSRETLREKEEELFNRYFCLVHEVPSITKQPSVSSETQPQEDECLVKCTCPRARYTQEEWDNLPKQLNPTLMSLREMSKAEKRLITETWQEMYKEPLLSGTMIFLKAFQGVPGFLDLFPTLKDEDPDEFCNDECFLSHIYVTMCTMNIIILNLFKPNKCTEIMFRVGVEHRHPAINKEHLDGLKYGWLAALPQLCHKFNKKLENTWCKFLEIAFGIMEDAFHWDDRGER